MRQPGEFNGEADPPLPPRSPTRDPRRRTTIGAGSETTDPTGGVLRRGASRPRLAGTTPAGEQQSRPATTGQVNPGVGTLQPLTNEEVRASRGQPELQAVQQRDHLAVLREHGERQAEAIQEQLARKTELWERQMEAQRVQIQALTDLVARSLEARPPTSVPTPANPAGPGAAGTTTAPPVRVKPVTLPPEKFDNSGTVLVEAWIHTMEAWFHREGITDQVQQAEWLYDGLALKLWPDTRHLAGLNYGDLKERLRKLFGVPIARIQSIAELATLKQKGARPLRSSWRGCERWSTRPNLT